MGAQLNINTPLTQARNLLLRIQYNDLTAIPLVADAITEAAIDSQMKLEIQWQTYGLILDWYPWTDGMAFSAGMLRQNISIQASDTQSLQIKKLGGITIPAKFLPAFDIEATIAADIDANLA